MLQKFFFDPFLVKHDPLRHFPYIIKDDGLYVSRHDMMREADGFAKPHVVSAVEGIEAFVAMHTGVLFQLTAAIGANEKCNLRKWTRKIKVSN